MDATRLARWTRRRLGLAVGALATTLLARSPAQPASAKKHCGKHKQRCKGKCIRRSKCCRDADCAPDGYCCAGACVPLDHCCRSGLCADCLCQRSVEGEQFCTALAPPLCAQCGSSAGCLPDERCFPATCGQGVTAVCRQLCGGE